MRRRVDLAALAAELQKTNARSFDPGPWTEVLPDPSRRAGTVAPLPPGLVSAVAPSWSTCAARRWHASMQLPGQGGLGHAAPQRMKLAETSACDTHVQPPHQRRAMPRPRAVAAASASAVAQTLPRATALASGRPAAAAKRRGNVVSGGRRPGRRATPATTAAPAATSPPGTTPKAVAATLASVPGAAAKLAAATPGAAAKALLEPAAPAAAEVAASGAVAKGATVAAQWVGAGTVPPLTAAGSCRTVVVGAAAGAASGLVAEVEVAVGCDSDRRPVPSRATVHGSQSEAPAHPWHSAFPCGNDSRTGQGMIVVDTSSLVLVLDESDLDVEDDARPQSLDPGLTKVLMADRAWYEE